MGKFVKAALLVASTGTAIFFGTGIASAATLYIDEVQHGVKRPVAVSECRADSGTCQIAAGKTIGSTITGGLGVTVGAINASLQAQYQKTYTVTTTCTSPILKRGQAYSMFPRGDFVFFRVDKKKGTAFLPTGVFCEVRNDWREDIVGDQQKRAARGTAGSDGLPRSGVVHEPVLR